MRILVLAGLVGCGDDDKDPSGEDSGVCTDCEGDTDTDSDADTDSDTDADTDSDTDTDTDTDSDSDADSDTDTDTDTDTDWLSIDELSVGDLVINEMMFNPCDAEWPTAQWLELANVSGHPVHLDGLVITASGSFSVTTLDVAADDVVVFGGSTARPRMAGAEVDYAWAGTGFVLGEELLAVDVYAGATLVDAVELDDPWKPCSLSGAGAVQAGWGLRTRAAGQVDAPAREAPARRRVLTCPASTSASTSGTRFGQVRVRPRNRSKTAPHVDYEWPGAVAHGRGARVPSSPSQPSPFPAARPVSTGGCEPHPDMSQRERAPWSWPLKAGRRDPPLRGYAPPRAAATPNGTRYLE